MKFCKIFLVVFLSQILGVPKIKGQDISLNSDTIHFSHIISINADSDEYQVYYAKDSLYLFYKLGTSGDYTYYYNGYSYPLSDNLSYKNEPDTTEIFYKHSTYLNRIKKLSLNTNIKSPSLIKSSDKNDLPSIRQYLKNREILQIADVNKNNVLVLIRDTANYQGYLIWQNKLSGKIEEFKVTSGDTPPEKLAMFLGYYNNKKQLSLIINQSYLGESAMGNLYSDFYILHLDKPTHNK